MVVEQAVLDARNIGYKRAWLMHNDFTVLSVEWWFGGPDSWKNGGLGLYLMDEYANEPVLKHLPHPTQSDTIMLEVEYKTQLHERAKERCLCS